MHTFNSGVALKFQVVRLKWDGVAVYKLRAYSIERASYKSDFNIKKHAQKCGQVET